MVVVYDMGEDRDVLGMTPIFWNIILFDAESVSCVAANNAKNQ